LDDEIELVTRTEAMAEARKMNRSMAFDLELD
jgi:hypothetical protein